MAFDLSEIFEDDNLLDEYEIKKLQKTSVDFVESIDVQRRSQDCIVQTLKKRELSSDQIRSGSKFIRIHSPEVIEIGELIEFQGKDFEIVGEGDAAQYGLFAYNAQETRRPLV